MKRPAKSEAPRDPLRVTEADARGLGFAAWQAERFAEELLKKRDPDPARDYDIRRAFKIKRDGEIYGARAREIRKLLRTEKQKGGAS